MCQKERRLELESVLVGVVRYLNSPLKTGSESVPVRRTCVVSGKSVRRRLIDPWETGSTSPSGTTLSKPRTVSVSLVDTIEDLGSQGLSR